MTESARESMYSIHPGYAYEAAALANLERKTGKTLAEWRRRRS